MDIRDTIRDIVTRYVSPKYQGQEGAFAQFLAREKGGELGVIINVLPKIIDDSPRLRKDFSQLSRAIRYLNHPHVIRVLEVAQEKGIPYLVNSVMDDARKLSTQLTSEPMDLERASQIVKQIGKALEYAGHKDVPHGSLSPDQVLLNERGEAVVGGFGLASLAALLGARNEDESSVYLAPEQRLPDHAPTMRGDVYSLAAILFRLLTGVEPDLQADSDKSLRVDQLNEIIPIPVGKVVAQGMSSDPLQRPRSADDFVVALLSAVRAPDTITLLARAREKQRVDAAGGPTWPEPLPFPEQVPMPAPNLSNLDEISREARHMLEWASELIEMPEYDESLELSEDDLPGFKPTWSKPSGKDK